MAKILIIYKSGAQLEVKCDSITVTHQGPTITAIRWENMKPSPLHLGVDDIAAVFEL